MFLQIEVNYNVSLLGEAECPKLYDQDEVIENWDNKLVLKCYCEQTFRGTLEEQLYHFSLYFLKSFLEQVLKMLT